LQTKPIVQRRIEGGAAGHTEAPGIVRDVLHSPGQPLDAGTRAFMEPRFGHDFSQVRIHADTKAAESAREVNALAYTVGRDMVFARGQYAQGTSEGRRLLVHELTHVVQQGNTASRLQRASDWNYGPLPEGWEGGYYGPRRTGVPPTTARKQPEKNITIDTVKLDGSTNTPSAGVAEANSIFSRCNIRLVHGVNATATNTETTGWLGGDTDLYASSACGSVSAEERGLWNGATLRFGMTGRLRAFYPATYSGAGGSGYSCPPYCATGPASIVRGMIVLSNNTTREDLAHEIGHILLNSGSHPNLNLMSPYSGRTVVSLTDAQCTTIYNNV
jgi:hypothetical protein